MSNTQLMAEGMPRLARPANAGEVLDRFRFHPATPLTGPMHDAVRKAHKELADDILSFVPAGRHQSLALTALQESMMWCNAAIACDLDPSAAS